MPKQEMLINFVPGEECRIAIVENGCLEEFYQERASTESHVGSIYKGRVTNVEPSIQAAFVDFGLERNGFLHISDLHPMYFPGEHKEETELVGQKTPRRERPPIQRCLRRGQEILVQVIKEGIGTKGPTLTSYLSIPGRYLVMMPYMERLGVSRKIEDDEARRESRQILAELKPPEGFGFIIRTAGIGRAKTELKRDLAYLVRLWRTIERRMKTSSRVGELYTESDLLIRTLRDVFSTDIERIIVDDAVAARRARDFLAIASPRTTSRVFLYQDPISLFHRFDIERQIENINSRTVPLPSGGSLVIDQAEALVAIDVNSGKNRENADAEMTAYKTDLEAADEVCRQLRLRDLGGVIVIDLIDLRNPKHRRELDQRFRNNLKNDRARTQPLPISRFGILEMTRQRMRPSLTKSTYAQCAHCQGSGQVKSPETVVLEVARRLSVAMNRPEVARIDLIVSPDVAFQLLNRKRAQLVALEQRHNKSVMVRVNSGGPIDFIDLNCFDSRGGNIVTAAPTHLPPPTLQPVEAEEPEELLEPEAGEEETAPSAESTGTESPVAAEDQDSAGITRQASFTPPPSAAGGLNADSATGPTRMAEAASALPRHGVPTEPNTSAAMDTGGTDAAFDDHTTLGKPLRPGSTTPSAQTPPQDQGRHRRRRGGRGRGGRGKPQDHAMHPHPPAPHSPTPAHHNIPSVANPPTLFEPPNTAAAEPPVLSSQPDSASQPNPRAAQPQPLQGQQQGQGQGRHRRRHRGGRGRGRGSSHDQSTGQAGGSGGGGGGYPHVTPPSQPQSQPQPHPSVPPPPPHAPPAPPRPYIPPHPQQQHHPLPPRNPPPVGPNPSRGYRNVSVPPNDKPA